MLCAGNIEMQGMAFTLVLIQPLSVVVYHLRSAAYLALRSKALEALPGWSGRSPTKGLSAVCLSVYNDKSTGSCSFPPLPLQNKEHDLIIHNQQGLKKAVFSSQSFSLYSQTAEMC